MDPKLTMKSKVGYMFGGAAGTTSVTIVLAFLTYYYTNVLGVDVAKVAIVMLISRVFDGISDLIAGFIIDRTHSKHGKARPWILWMAVPNLIGIIAMFTVPAGTEAMQLVYIFCAYNFSATIVNTMIGLAVSTLNSLITQDPKDRASLNIFRQFGAPVMELIIASATMPVVVALGGDQKAWIIVMSCYAVISTICYLICFKWTKELPQEILGGSKEKVPVLTALKALFTNKYWWLMLLTWNMCIFYMTASATILSYYCQYLIGNVTAMSGINLAEKLSTIVFTVILVPLLVKKMRKKNIMLSGAIIVALGHLIVLADPLNVTIATVAAAIRGMGIAACYGVLFAMIADTVEYGQWKSHVRTEGLIFSAATMGQKFASGIASALVGGLLGMVGYDGMLAVQNEAATEMISRIYIWGPTLFFGIVIILMLFHKLDVEMPKILSDLKQRRK